MSVIDLALPSYMNWHVSLPRVEFQPPCKRIQVAVSRYFEVPLSELIAPRTHAAALPRHVAMYLTRQQTKMSLPEIGRRFGGRDHTTVIHAIRKVTRLRNEDPKFDKEVVELESILEAAA